MESDGTPRRRGRPGHDRDAVVRTAIELFNRRGYDATSVADVAAALGVSKSAVFHHVASKEELLGAALDEALAGLTAAVAAADRMEAGTGDVPAAERLRAVVTESVRILVAHLPAVTLLLRVRGNSDVEQAALARRREIDDRVAALVHEAVEAGDLRADLDPALVSRLLLGTVNSLVEWYRPDGPVDAAHLADAVASLVFDGLAPRPQAGQAS